jgi:hypothetical protein
MRTDVVYVTEKSIIEDMIKEGIEELTMFITAYVDSADNYQKYGYTVEDVGNGYYQEQNELQDYTKTFNLSLTV